MSKQIPPYKHYSDYFYYRNNFSAESQWRVMNFMEALDKLSLYA